MKMTKIIWKIKKLIILWTGTLLIVLMCLFPPWVYEGKIVRHAYYLFSDVRTRAAAEYGWHYGVAHIDFVRLIIQCAIVGLITGALLYTLKDKKTETGGK